MWALIQARYSGVHEGRALGAFHDQEVQDGRQGQAAEDAADAAVHALIVEGEDQAGDILHHHTGHEGHRGGGGSREKAATTVSNDMFE